MSESNNINLPLKQEHFFILFELVEDHIFHLNNFLEKHGKTNGLNQQLLAVEQIKNIFEKIISDKNNNIADQHAKIVEQYNQIYDSDLKDQANA